MHKSAKTNGAMPIVGVRVQGMPFGEQVLVLSRLAAARAEGGGFTPKQIDALFTECALPKPTNISDVIGKLRGKGLVRPGTASGTWILTPLGRQYSCDALSDLDLTGLTAETKISSSSLGHAPHTLVPPALAPPSLIPGLQRFLSEFPFERNVFGMTRFPESEEQNGHADPVAPALLAAREVCRTHGLVFHLASDRAIDDDLWTNVAAHMWACQYGVAFFEDRRDRGLNYNLTIEVGSMLMTGRRCALLKDRSIPRMPTDLVGRIYKSVDFDDENTIRKALHDWIRQDLGLGACAQCVIA